MARWYARDVTGEPFGETLEAPNSREALDRATALYGQRVESVVSYLSWQETLAKREADARKRARQAQDDGEDDEDNRAV